MKRQKIKHLPEELIVEILSNLRGKSVLRFKSVSKPWRSLISSPEFVQDHLNRSNSDHTLIATFSDEETGLTLRSCSLNSLLDEPNKNDVVSTWEHHYPTTANTDLPIKIPGSCNGLILLIKSETFFTKWCDLFLWNPSTRKVKTIPSPLSQQDQRADCWGYFTNGFGYDDLTHDYKVVCFIHCILGHTLTYETKIYSARTDSWKKIDNFGDQTRSCRPCKFVNGKLHQLACKDLEWSIVSLSLGEGEEKYQVLAWPNNFSRYGLPELENLGGYLSLIQLDHRSKDRGVWVMMTYGVEESWTKIWTPSDFCHDPALPLDVVATKPLWMTESGDIFVFFGKSKVVVFNGENKLREYQIGEDEKLQGEFNRIVYVESLVSP